MSTASRIAKLRRMAEHPTSNPHEAAIAREEMERLLKAIPEARENSWRHVGQSSSMNEFASRYADMRRRDHPRFCYLCRVQILHRTNLITRCPEHQETMTPGIVGYYEWARSLSVGERVRSHKGWGSVLSDPMTITRMTATQYVMSDGSRFRRAGQFAGYKVGEDGRSDRTYMTRCP